MTTQRSTAGAELLAIPDRADSNTLRIGIQVTPSAKIAGAIAIDSWPKEIARLAERMRIRIGTLAAGQVTELRAVPARSQLGAFFDPSQYYKGKTRRDAATAMWQEIFKPVGFTALMDSIASMSAEPAMPPPIASSRVADLQLFLDKLHLWREARVPLDRTGLARDIRGLAQRITGWMAAGPSPLAAPLAKSLASDSMAARAEQLDRLRRGIDHLLSQGDDPATHALVFAAKFEAEIATMFRDHWTRLFGEKEPKPPVKEPDTLDWGAKPEQAAGRKLSALLALPTLTHYLGLGVQVEIPRSSLEGLTTGAIAAEFVDEAGNRVGGETAWTAFDLDGSYFGPAPNPDAVASAKLFRQGYLNLGATIDGSEPRFALRADDAVNTLHDLVRTTENEKSPDLKRYRRGLALYDRATPQQLEETEKRATSGPITVNYLEDMLAGVRPDIGIAKRGAVGLGMPPERWRPVTARTISCVHDELDPAFYAEPLIAQLAPRDHGYALAITEYKDGKISREDELMVWAGESLAVHVQRPGDPAPTVDPARDLALQLTYRLPDPHTGVTMPPLRESIGYACGCRLVYVNGSGPLFDEAAWSYAHNPSIVIGDDRGRPYLFPSVQLPPPDVHLAWDDPIVLANDPEIETAGEANEILVVRDGEGSARRLVTPPRGSFDGAEQQRLFDAPSLHDDRPLGAFSGGKAALWLFGEDGRFPEARFGRSLGSIRFLEGNMLMPVPLDGRRRPEIEIGSPDYMKIKYRQSRGTVAILGRRRAPASPTASFFPDANGARLMASLERLSVLGSDTPLTTADRDFWKSPQGPADALPIIVDLVPAADAASFAATREIALRDVDGRSVNLPYLKAQLPKGETYQLTLAGDTKLGDGGAVALKLVHAVRKPLRSPDFTPKETPDEMPSSTGIGLRAVTVTVANDDPGSPPAGALETWAQKVLRYEASGIDMRCWSSEEGGTTTFFTGRVDIDRKSTGNLRCEAVWCEFNEGTVSRAANGRWIRNIASETAQLFALEVERLGGEGQINLLRSAPEPRLSSLAAQRHARVTGKPGELRMLTHAFRDGRARALAVKMVATSAFIPFYPEAPDPPATGEWIGRYDVESSRFVAAPTVWTDCTFRPPPPCIDRALPLFSWSKIAGQRESSRRLAHVRIFLDEGWYASGEDERLGVILLGEDNPETVCDYEEGRLAPYHRFISQAGADPVRNGAPVPLRLSSHHFRDAPPPVEAALFLGDGDGVPALAPSSVSGIAPLRVKILPFAPRFSEEDGLYCDIELDIGPAYLPFVRLGLVRYQAHAVDHLRLSHPIAYDVQLLPERRLWVEVRDPKGAGKRTVVVEGPGFEVPALGQASHKPNMLRLSLLSWDAVSAGWRQHSVIGAALSPEIDPLASGYRWRKDFDLPLVGYDPQSFMLVAEEYELLPQDHPTGAYQNGESLYDEVDGERLSYACFQLLAYPRS
ncbi:hypothetical protein [Burkholderia sp. Ac-20365]|uniref:hypothetical protein n=1 Tax=Burkholderia sp. Ac-20365 TaxID=2703897 RepID=UPI00197C1FDC|nr:hypothetical protein [Burkholderia sp. Ac-20365]MBN3760724.1 hypothetical protein [Burkholderia sp. Ac-20365]